MNSIVSIPSTRKNVPTSMSVVERCQQILCHYEAESSNPEYETARWVVEQLSQDEQEVAARCSYAYWYVATLPEQQRRRIHRSVESARFSTAMREAFRHTACADDPQEILRLLRETLQFHISNKTHMYRACMTTDDSVNSSTTESLDDVFLSRQRKARIHDEMTNYQTNVVRGHDKEDRAIFFAFPRKQSGNADEESEQAFVDSVVYSLERTLAASEFQSMGRQDELFVVVDTKGASCPPIKTLQAAVGVLQKYYPCRLKHCVVLNAPFVLSGIWKMLKPFLDPTTASKFMFPSSKASKKPSIISELIEESQAMPVLMPGRGKLDPHVDTHRFLYEVPFHNLYDDAIEEGLMNKPPSPTESSLTMSTMSASDLSSMDSETSNTKLRKRTKNLFRTLVKSRKKHFTKPKPEPVKVIKVRSLATGTLSRVPKTTLLPVNNEVMVHSNA